MPRFKEKELRDRSHAVEGRIVLIEGKEDLLKARALQGIVDRALPEDMQHYGLRTLECAKPAKGVPAKPGAAEILAAAQTKAFLSPTSVVVVREIQRLPANEERKLAKWLVNVPEGSLLILLAGGDGSAGRSLAKAVAKDGTVVTAAALRRRDAVPWAREEAKALGKEIEPEAARFLVYERTGPGLRQIRSELEKLVLYAADAPKITRRHVEEAASRSVEDRIWDLTDAMSLGSRAQALAILRDLLREQREPPERIVAGIAGHIRALWQIKCLLDRGWRPGKKAPESAAEVLLTGRSAVNRVLAENWRAEKTARQARAFTWPTLRAALRRLAACDLAVKEIEGGGNKEVALDLLVTALCARPRAPRPGGARPQRPARV